MCRRIDDQDLAVTRELHMNRKLVYIVRMRRLSGSVSRPADYRRETNWGVGNQLLETRKMKYTVRGIATCLFSAIIVLGGAGTGQAQQTKKPVIGLVMKSLANEFFKDMQEGAVKHAEERGDLTLIPVGMHSETDIDTQVNAVENFITQKWMRLWWLLPTRVRSFPHWHAPLRPVSWSSTSTSRLMRRQRNRLASTWPLWVRTIALAPRCRVMCSRRRLAREEKW